MENKLKLKYMNKVRYIYIFLTIILIGLNSACERDDWSENYDVEFPEPTITGFSPENARIGDVVTVSGTNLDKIQVVSVGNKAMTGIDEASATQLKFTLSGGTQGGRITVRNIYRRVSVSQNDLIVIP
jgi:hypothetical protein